MVLRRGSQHHLPSEHKSLPLRLQRVLASGDTMGVLYSGFDGNAHGVLRVRRRQQAQQRTAGDAHYIPISFGVAAHCDRDNCLDAGRL